MTLYGTNVIISISTLVVELQFSYRTVVLKEGGQYFVGVAICIVDQIVFTMLQQMLFVDWDYLRPVLQVHHTGQKCHNEWQYFRHNCLKALAARNLCIMIAPATPYHLISI